MKKEIEKQLNKLKKLCEQEDLSVFLIDNNLANQFIKIMNSVKKKTKKTDETIDTKKTFTTATENPNFSKYQL